MEEGRRGGREKEGSEENMYSSIKTIENNRKQKIKQTHKIKIKKKRERQIGLPPFIVISSEKPSRKRRGTSRN